MRNNLIKCPVCKIKYLSQGLKNHIINTAKGELWRKEKKKPHYDFYWKHCNVVKSKSKKGIKFYMIKK